MLANVTTPLLGIVATAAIGRLGDAAILGGVGMASLVFDCLFWLFGFLRMSAIALTAQALGADDQLEQRAVLARNADRLEAERTRLVWTLEGIATQLVRMRSAELPVTGTIPAELETSVAQLRQEIDAVADALDATAFEAPAGDLGEASTSGRSRERV